MHDIKFIRENPESFDNAMKKRNISELSASFIESDKILRYNMTELQVCQSRRNEIAREIAKKKSLSENIDDLIAESDFIKKKQEKLDDAVNKQQADINYRLSEIPNMLQDDVPEGVDENDNIMIRSWGTPKSFDFEIKDHYELGQKLGMLDFEKAAEISGSRFVIMSSLIARLERALINFMLDHNTKEYGYKEFSVPQLVKEHAVYGAGQLPKFEDDLFKTTTGHYLISTSEVTLTNMVMGEIIPQENLPLRFTSHTQCYRSEAGSAGKDTKGMIRLHQFSKVEIVSITYPQDSEQEHQRMCDVSESLLKKLEIPYRVMLLCAGDTGFHSSKTYDIEVWMPGQNKYREIASCSNCKDFQARRINAKYKEFRGLKNHFVHTLNGSALPIGRTIVAIMENYQNSDGSVTIPSALLPYMGGVKTIGI